MKAVTFSKFGAPDVLEITELPIPQPGAGEVVIEVAASTVNPTDLMMRSGRQASLMTSLTPPYIAGMEFAGHIHTLGDGVKSFSIGQPVMGVVNPRRPAGGSHTQYLCVSAKSITAVDPAMDLVQASTVPMNGLTVKMALDLLALNPGQTVLVTGAAGAIGGYLIQMAKHLGLQVVADAKDSDRETVRKLGADVIVPRGPEMIEVVRRHFPQGVDALVDAALVGDTAASLVRDGGTAVSLRKSNPINDPRLQAHYVSVIEKMEDTPALDWLGKLLQSGVITPRIGQTFPMSQASTAHSLLEQGGIRGRVVLLFKNS